MKATELIGLVFGNLTVVRIDTENKKRLTKVICKCSCGNTTSAYASNISMGKTKSCGCGQTSHFIKHDMYGKKIYRVWGAMIQRCTNPNDPHYDRYGGRGISVSESWRDFANFYKDMGDSNGLTLERIDNSLCYSKENCKWATRKEQTRNRDVTAIYEAHGNSMTLNEWAEHLNLSSECLRGRIRRGWANEKTFNN